MPSANPLDPTAILPPISDLVSTPSPSPLPTDPIGYGSAPSGSTYYGPDPLIYSVVGGTSINGVSYGATTPNSGSGSLFSTNGGSVDHSGSGSMTSSSGSGSPGYTNGGSGSVTSGGSNSGSSGSTGSTGSTDGGSNSGSTGSTDGGSNSGSTGSTDGDSSSGSTGSTDGGSSSGSTGSSGSTDGGSSSGSSGSTDGGSSSGSDSGSGSGSGSVSVQIDMNDTVTHSDDVAFVGQAMAVRVTLEAPGVTGLVTIHFALETAVGGGQALLSTDPNQSQSSGSNGIDLKMSNGQSVELYLTATQISALADDIHLVAFFAANKVGEGTVAGVIVKFGSGTTYDRQGKIYADSTPAAMLAGDKPAYRIAPRTWTDLWVQEDGNLGGGESLFLKVLGQGDNNGWVQVQSGGLIYGGDFAIEFKAKDFTLPVQGSNAKYLKASVRGYESDDKQTVYQTKPGFAGQLVMVVVAKKDEADATKGATSAGFSVAAIPIRMTMKDGVYAVSSQKIKDQAGKWLYQIGAIFTGVITSDSDNPKDLDQVMIQEVVKTGKGTGALAGAFLNASGASKGYTDEKTPFIDIHTLFKTVTADSEASAEIAGATLVAQDTLDKGAGKLIADQYMTFFDLRTGGTDKTAVNMANSGFEITYEFRIDKEKKIVTVVVTKAPKANNGVAVGTMPKEDLESITLPFQYK